MNIKRSRPTVSAAAPDGRTAPATPERILQRLDWQVIRRLDGLLQGDYRSLFYGYGVDFADLREYQPQDDIRYIDWNVTARMNTPYIRTYVEDREITAWFLLDLTPSMDFGSAVSDKRAVLIDLVATFTRLLSRHGNRVGALFYSGRPPKAAERGETFQSPRRANPIDRVIPPGGSRVHVLHLIHSLLNQPVYPSAPSASLAPLIENGLRAIQKRSLIFLVSDFISAPGWERPLHLLGQRHEVLAIRLWDPREKDLPDVGPLIMEDAETGEQLYIDTHDVKFRARFQELALQRETALGETLKHAGVDLFSLSTGEDFVRAIVRFAGLRQQQKRQRH